MQRGDTGHAGNTGARFLPHEQPIAGCRFGAAHHHRVGILANEFLEDEFVAA